ncbi:hypothetical protein PIIN_10558 [Serendipita indica DSM 11827]|uniref:Uncharacterized protein n=1 Tax=Serendipita indica (strain DSM 11827) TaxID=1109443 RepID=G4TZ22_SERID|nr:hypothetical protein PIIN_10558 [Serendipita indica DSM 11827]
MSQIHHLQTQDGSLPTPEEIASTSQEIRSLEDALDTLRASILKAQKRAEELQSQIDRKRAKITPHPKTSTGATFSRLYNVQSRAVECTSGNWKRVSSMAERPPFHSSRLGLSFPERSRSYSDEALDHKVLRRRVLGDILETLSISCQETDWSRFIVRPFLVSRFSSSQVVETLIIYKTVRPTNSSILSFHLSRICHLLWPSAIGVDLFAREGFPPIKGLVLANPQDRAWIQLLEYAAPHLISLGLWLETRDSLKQDESPLPVHLPELTHLTHVLELSCSWDSLKFTLALSTPRPRFYYEDSAWTADRNMSPIHQDVSSVREAFTEMDSLNADLSYFQSLEELTIHKDSVQC